MPSPVIDLLEREWPPNDVTLRLVYPVEAAT